MKPASSVIAPPGPEATWSMHESVSGRVFIPGRSAQAEHLPQLTLSALPR
jgi:hypothetical protein